MRGLFLLAFSVLCAGPPEDPDALFYLGRNLSKKGDWNQAEKVLKECLALAPNYIDAAVQLINLYIWEGRLQEAEDVCSHYKLGIDGKECCAKIAFFRGDFTTSDTLYREVLAKEPSRIEAQEGLARTLMAERDYKGAGEIYTNLHEWQKVFEARKHLSPSLSVSAFHVFSKENDPSVHATVVNTYYNAINSKLFVPVGNRVILDFKGIFFQQKEVEVYHSMGDNYDVIISGGEGGAHYEFADGWKWDLILRGITAWGVKETTYPFQKTSRFEPGTAFIYSQGAHLAAVDAHVESFIIKNFSVTESQLLELDEGGVLYLFRPDIRYHPRGEVYFNETYFHGAPHNWRDTEGFELSFSPHRTSQMVTLTYTFEHTHFAELNQNYFSYKNQYCNLFGIQFHYDFPRGASIEFLYEGGFQDTYQLVQPIGTFIFAANQQNLRENHYVANFFYQWHEHFRAQFGGEYFMNTLPYSNWKLSTSFFWQF